MPIVFNMIRGLGKWGGLLRHRNPALKIIGDESRRGMSSYGKKIVFEPPHLDEMPVPRGSWDLHYRAQNAKYNRQLILGIGFWLGTLIFINRSGIIFFNWSPPPLEGEGADVDDCVPPPPKKC